MNNLNKSIFLCSILVFLCIASSGSVFAFSWNPPNGRTGAPNENTCAAAGCHSGNALNAAGGSLMLTVPGVYTPGMEYEIVVQLARAGQERWGFQMTALNSNNARAGTFATVDGNTQLDEQNSKQYIEHTLTGTSAGTNNANSWRFKWTAPSIDVGPIMFYAAGNAANNAAGSLGDYIYTQKATSDSITYGVSLDVVGNSNKRITDASTGVTYTLRVTNTGNTNDTIRLRTSGDANATLSQLSVTLGAGASRNVTLTVSDNKLQRSGDYNVKVTATSQADNSETAEVTTTTTVLPVYGVQLAGVGSLTKQTTDASTGVTYTLRVTNSGNTNDTVRLAVSGDATATISPSSISLNQGASRTVTLRVSGAALAKAGAYNVKVTATSQGDSDQTAESTTTTTILPVYDITLTGVGELTQETEDASDGILYAITITNNGNTDDKVNLTTSGDVAATLSSTEVSIAYGASETIALAISGDVLAFAGDYEVRVSASSQGDSDQTAEILTTTTILPVYDIALEGVGELTTETADASEGVSWTIKVTNNGNTDDVIDLATEGTDATLGQTSVSLASGASADVTLTISGDVLGTAGTYEVKVTAVSQGDDSKTASVATTTTVLPVYGVTLASDTRTGATMDMVAGVAYTLTVTNTGNTEDTIVLSSSAEVGIGGAVLGAFSLPASEAPATSQLEIMLAAGASADVIFTASGDLLTQPGEYEIVVTATSQGDTTKTVGLTTTTTIAAVPPEYGVQLQGKDELTGATTDILRGVTYTLTVTNTGNTEDTIVLSSSAEFGIEGSVLGSFSQETSTSQLQITLAAGETAEVKFTAAGDSFTKPGEYEIVVTVTSQGDTTKIAEITTTTTIEPVPWDLNADGAVNILDLVAVANQFGESGDGLSGDVNMDGAVNILDLVAVANQFGKTQAEIVQANQ